MSAATSDCIAIGFSGEGRCIEPATVGPLCVGHLGDRFICPEHGLPMVSDTFSGEGGVTRGLMAAGFCVTAVDNDPNRLKYNPAQHKVLGDAIAFIVEHGHKFLLNWGSPTCTGYSRGTVAVPDRIGKYDRLIAATREAFEAAGRPWVIENVEDAARLGEIRDPQLLCGRMFGLTANDADGEPLVLDRHRVFEATFDIKPPAHPNHGAESVAGVYGGARVAGWRDATGRACEAAVVVVIC